MSTQQPENNICITCLSTDRELCQIETDVICVFKTIGLDMQHGGVCWECRAIVNKIITFKKKAILASRILIDHFKGTTLQCLSTLNTKNKDSYDEIILSKIENENPTRQHPEDSTVKVVDDIKLEISDEEHNDFDTSHNDVDSDTENLNVHKEKNLLNDNNKAIPLAKEVNNDTNVNNSKSKTRKKKKKKHVKDEKTSKDSINVINERDIELVNSNNYIKCDITEDVLMHLRDKERSSSIFMRTKIKCMSCIIPFHNDLEFRNHNLSVHSESIGSYMCLVCLSRFPDIHNYERHKQRHLSTYKCGMCKYSCLSGDTIQRHMDRNHAKEYYCNLCSKTFNSKGAARYHIKMHNMEECKLCGKQFSNLKLHMISHSKVRTEQCPICQKSLKSKASLRFHLLTHEASRKDDAYCAECDIHYKNKHIYRMHLNTAAKHTVPDKECDYCQRKFISKFSLAKHINVVHYNKLDHVCHLCGKKFSIAGHLRNHILVHHEGGSKPRKHICDLCGKGFAIKKCLNDHINSHTGARPYKCTSCTAQFGFKSALYMHNRLKHQHGRKGKKHAAVSLAPT